MCWPLSALTIVYFETITGNYALAFAIFSIEAFTQTFGEIPTGILSDIMGRRYTMIAGSFSMFFGSLCFALAGTFHSTGLLMIGGVLWGLSNAFRSGTDEALIHDTMTELRKRHKYDIVFSKSHIFRQLGGATSSVVAISVLYFYPLSVLAWISVIPDFTQSIISLLLVEPKINVTKGSNPLVHLRNAIKNIRHNGYLKKVALLVCCNKAIDITSYRMESTYFNHLIPTWLVNAVILIRQACGAISFSIAPLIRKIGFLKIVIVSIFGNILFRVIGLILNNILSPFVMVLQNLFLGTANTSESALLQKEFSDKERATMGSLVSLFEGIIKAISYYVFGFIADIAGIYVAIVLLIAAKGLIGTGYTLLARRKSA